MGSSSPSGIAITVAVVSGILFLVFDAGRHFAHQLGPVRLRRLAGDAEEAGQREGRWTRYEVENFQLVSGALLQIALVLAVAFTMVSFDSVERSTTAAMFLAIAIWLPIVMLWKFVLAFVPEEATEFIVRGIIPISHFFYYVFWPVLFPLRTMVARFENDAEEDEEDEDPTDAEVQAYIDVGEEEGILEPAEGKLLQSIVDFTDRVAREIMTPRIDVLAFDARHPLDELARLFAESKYARIPIYRDSIDQITGIIHIKDLFDAMLKGEQKTPADIARPPYFISETKLVAELLREFQSEHIQAAVVVDEYGGTAGMVTIEDIVEEIVGEIADEHEEEEPTVVEIGDETYLVSGLLRVELLEEKLDAELRDDDYETVAGLIFTTLGRVPNVGAVVKKNGWRFEVDRADRRRIYRVKVSRDPEWKANGEEEDGE
jgi:CBS domain containing-hemolysin-like protein